MDGEWPLDSLGDGRDTANGALYLAADEVRFVTGTEIVVDGGMIARCDRTAGALTASRGFSRARNNLRQWFQRRPISATWFAATQQARMAARPRSMRIVSGPSIVALLRY
jgi:hypothetical protein